MFKELMSGGNKASMMRYAVFFTLKIAGFLSLILGIVLLVKAYKCETIDWIGAAIFLGSIATLITGVTGVKAYQKKAETAHLKKGSEEDPEV